MDTNPDISPFILAKNSEHQQTVAMQIPLVDLKAQYAAIKTEIDAAIAAVIADTAFISGKYARAFEEEFARYSGLPH